jgi:hypothetical protein
MLTALEIWGVCTDFFWHPGSQLNGKRKKNMIETRGEMNEVEKVE